MADRTPSQSAAEILRLVADIQKDLGELIGVTTAERAALRDLLPDFESRFVEHLGDKKSLQIKHEYEHKIRVLLEAADRMSKN